MSDFCENKLYQEQRAKVQKIESTVSRKTKTFVYRFKGNRYCTEKMNAYKCSL